MLRVVIRRVFWMIPTIFVVSVITFVLMHLTPGGPWDAAEGRKDLSPAAVANLNRVYNLDKSWPEQYAIYMWNALRGDLGPSYQFRDQNVSDILFKPAKDRPFWESKFGRSAELGLMAFLISTPLALLLGVLAAVHQNTWIDYFSLFLATLGTAIPSFVRAVFLIVIFGLMLKWVSVSNSNWNTFNPENANTWTPWILPVVTLTMGLIAGIARYTRVTMLETIRQDYVRTARSKGLREGVILIRHALKNALIPVVTILGPELAGLVTGSFFVETIFQFPGMGRNLVTSLSARDYSMIMGTTLFLTLLLVMSNLAVDLLYGWLDPRVKVGY